MSAPCPPTISKRGPVSTRSLPTTWHAHSCRKRAGATKRKRKVKCTHVASACTSPEKKVQRDDDVSVSPPSSSSSSSSSSEIGISVRRQFPPRDLHRRPSPPHYGITSYLHRVCNLPPFLSYPFPIPPPPRATENSTKSTRKNRTYLKTSLRRNRQKPRRNFASNHIEMKARRPTLFSENRKFGKIKARVVQGGNSSQIIAFMA